VARFADALPEGDTGAILSAFFFSPPVVSHEWRRTDSRGLKAFCAREEAMKSKAINMAAVEMRRIFIMRSKFLKLAPERQNLNFGDEWSNLLTTPSKKFRYNVASDYGRFRPVRKL
jgi:hypothetical protein